MKSLKMVPVLLVGVALFAAPALAAVSGTAHDLSSASGTDYGADSAEICVYCHTPHEASTAGPLWNRTNPSGITDVYGNPNGTINATLPVNYDSTDAVLCLSCHDGSSMTAALVNPPNNVGTLTWNASAGNSGNISGTANLGTDLSNDHPIGFVYDNTLVTADGELEAKATVEAVPGMAGALSFGGTNDQMWCSSCHDVHNDTNTPFLRVSNASSALCTSCHQK